MNQCKGIIGFLFGHKFEERCDEENGTGKWPFSDTMLSNQQLVFSSDVSNVIMATASSKSTYVKDVCVRCGKVIVR